MSRGSAWGGRGSQKNRVAGDVFQSPVSFWGAFEYTRLGGGGNLPFTIRHIWLLDAWGDSFWPLDTPKTPCKWAILGPGWMKHAFVPKKNVPNHFARCSKRFSGNLSPLSGVWGGGGGRKCHKELAMGLL